MNPQKIIGSPITLALIIIFGAASCAIVGLFASSTTLALYGLLVVIAAATSTVFMVKNIASAGKSRLETLNLNSNKQQGTEQDQG